MGHSDANPFQTRGLTCGGPKDPEINPFQVGDVVEDRGSTLTLRGYIGPVTSVDGRWVRVRGEPSGYDYIDFCLVGHVVTPYIDTSAENPKDPSVDPENPKDLVGSHKVALSLWPAIATFHGSLALMDGARKYGRANYRVSKVRASIYVDAALRHIACYNEGEEIAEDSGVSHLGHALACLAILLDAKVCGTLVDDRPYPGGFLDDLADLNDISKVIAGGRQQAKDWTRMDLAGAGEAS